MNRTSRTLCSFLMLLVLVSLWVGCHFTVSEPVYTKDSILQTLKSYGVTAHYAARQDSAHLLDKAKGQRYLLQIDSIDQYQVPNGWVEVYLYPDATSAYEDSLCIRQEFQTMYHYDAKIAALQGKTLQEPPFPLFQQGNLIVFASGVSDNPETIKRLTQWFGPLQQNQDGGAAP